MRKIDLAILIVQLAAGACVSREHSSSLYNERMQFQANCSSYFRKKFKDNKGVPTSDPPIPFQCWNHIQNVGAIFCLLTGTDGFSRFDWLSCQLECKNSDFPMGLPFDKLDPDELVTCPTNVESVLKTWEERWNERKQKATKNLCAHGKEH
uniref:Putative salivary secreted protein n=1 Tax=Ixodes ricinus TaxID=34613 RepID=A0A6B0UV16_IXORI